MSRLSTLRSRLLDGSQEERDITLSADVCIIGSGAGGAVSAAVLAEAGFDVLVVEEGGYHDASEFTMREMDVASKLYQEGMQRTTADLGISILQGRAVGGTTVVNWTTSFRTPEDVVAHWEARHAVRGFSYRDLVPHYEAIEARLGIHKVEEASMNANNRKLFDGCKAMGWSAETLRRNVVACLQTGQCGLGCPVNAKRSMLVTMIPDAVDAGARVLHHARVDTLAAANGQVNEASVTFLTSLPRENRENRNPDAKTAQKPTGVRATVRAKRFILSGGAINSPALLLRSGLNDNGKVGHRTFLHPVVASVAAYDEPIDGYRGAPQSAASHHFANRGGQVGLFLEAAPTYPAMSAAAFPGFGKVHRDRFAIVGRCATHIALAIDGFHDDVQGGKVALRPSGAPLLDYPIGAPLWEAFRFAQRRLAELQFASGAKRVLTLHDPPVVLDRVQDLERLDRAAWQIGSLAIFTAHQMGGCAMGDDPQQAVVRSEDLRHHRLTNLYVIDGSVFPTSLGVNPQESIYGLARLMSSRLAGLGKG